MLRDRPAGRAVDARGAGSTTSRRRFGSGTPTGWPPTRCAARSSSRAGQRAVNRGGTSFFYRAVEETGASAADVSGPYVVVREVFGLAELWAAVEALDNMVPTEAQTAVYLEGRRLLDRAVRWLLSQPALAVDVRPRSTGFRPGVAGAAAEAAASCSAAASARRRAANAPTLAELGVPGDAGRAATRLMYGVRPARHRRDRAHHRRRAGRGGRRVLRAVGAVPGRPAAVADLPAAARGPVADAGPDGAALRPVRGAGRADRGGAGGSTRRGAGARSGCTSGSSPTRRRSRGPATRSASSAIEATWPRCRCCSARSAPWYGRRRRNPTFVGQPRRGGALR